MRQRHTKWGGYVNNGAVQELSQVAQKPPQSLICKMKSLRSHPIGRDNSPIISITAAYIVAVYAVQSFFGIHDKLLIKFYADWFVCLATVFSGLFLLFHILKGSYRQYSVPNAVAGFLIVFLLTPFFIGSFASFKQTLPLINDFSWDRFLMRLDYFLHFGHHPWRLLEPILSYPIILRAIDLMYVLWYVLLFLSFLWMAWSAQRRLRLCFFASALLVWSILGSGLGAIFSSAGPCYYAHVIPSGENPYAPLMSRLDEIHRSGSLYAIHSQSGLWEAKLHNTWMMFGGISAMPSIHVAMAIVFVLIAFNERRWLGWIFVGYAAMIQVGSVILGWHYAVDGYASILLTSLIWFSVDRFVKHPAQSGS
jgi:hypothetical protein